MSALTLGKLGALADVSTVLPTLTETELRRLCAGRAMRKGAVRHYRASTLAEEAVGPLTALETVLDRLSDLDGLLGMGTSCASRPDESPEPHRRQSAGDARDGRQDGRRPRHAPSLSTARPHHAGRCPRRRERPAHLTTTKRQRRQPRRATPLVDPV